MVNTPKEKIRLSVCAVNVSLKAASYFQLDSVVELRHDPEPRKCVKPQLSLRIIFHAPLRPSPPLLHPTGRDNKRCQPRSKVGFVTTVVLACDDVREGGDLLRRNERASE